jgi:pyruvate dehydrogenase E2 component (dihydrolipoamide acetyltransferase)
MAFEFRFPDVGEGIAEGEIVRWLVAVGDTVRADQTLAEIETDKAVVEIPSPRTGTVRRLAVREGEKIQVGEILVVIDEDGDMALPSEPPAASVSVVGALPATDTVLPPPPEMAALAHVGHSIGSQVGPGTRGGFGRGNANRAAWPDSARRCVAGQLGAAASGETAREVGRRGDATATADPAADDC